MRHLRSLSLSATLAFPMVLCAQTTADPQAGTQVPATAPGTPAPTTSSPVPSGNDNPGGMPRPLPKPDLPPTPANNKKAKQDVAAKADSLPSPGEALDPHIKAGSEADVNAIGTRNIGGPWSG